MTKLKRLKIHQYRNVRPCELVFSDRFNVLLGPNGAGKTTLLNFISKVLQSNLADPSDPFSFALDLTFPEGRLTGAIDNLVRESEQPALSEIESAAFAARPGARKGPRPPNLDLQLDMLEPRLSVSIQRDGTTFQVRRDDKEETLLSLKLLATSGSYMATILGFAAPKRDFAGMYQSVRNAYRFDEGLDTFRALTAREDDASALTGEDLRPAVSVVQFNNEVAGQTHITGQGIVTKSIVAGIREHLSKSPTDISFHCDELQFLSEATRLMGLRSAEAKLELIEKSVQQQPVAEFSTFGNLKFWFTRKDGSIFQDHQLSYGQKRLLAFLYYLDANPSFVIADELVNGLHHAWIDECIRAIGDRQAFLTSQNPLLLDYLSFASPQEVKECFILCSTEMEGSREWMVWRNPTDDEADMFYSAYRVGIEHVSEILRTRGLW